MEWNNNIIALICGAIVLVGSVGVVFQIYKMTIIDAKARGLKHPKLWGFIAMNGNNSSGLLLYLIGRRRFPIINMSEIDRKEIESRKKKTGIGLLFLMVGAIGLIIYITLLIK